MPLRIRIDLAPCICRARVLRRPSARSINSSSCSTRQRLELENLRARDERAVDVEERIVSRRADQPQISAFDIGQQDVLLRFVEVMNLIDEEDRLLSRSADAVGRRGHHFAHLGDVAFHAAQPFELRLRHLRDDLRQRRFARSRRAGENDRRQPIRLNRAAQKFSWREDVLLPDKFLERTRPHARRQRRSGRRRLHRFHFLIDLEEILHRESYGGCLSFPPRSKNILATHFA